MNPGIEIIEFDDRLARETVRMWRASKRAAIGQDSVHSFEDDLKYLTTEMARTNRVFLAMDAERDKVVGLLAVEGAEINQLYVHVRYQGRGIGSRLLRQAKELSPGRLELFTFEVNHKARAFYEKHGFREIGRGFPNEETLPDIKLEWVCADQEESFAADQARRANSIASSSESRTPSE